MWIAIIAGAVILLGVALTVIGLQHIHQTQANERISNTISQLGTIVSQVHQSYGTSPNGYTAINLSDLIKLGTFPQNMVKGTSVIDAWGGAVTVTSAAANKWTLTFAGLPISACARMGSATSGSVIALKVNAKSVTLPPSVANMTANCTTKGQGPSAGNTVAWTYY